MKAVGENKRCSKCQEWKHVSEFHPNKTKPDGFQSYCKPCASAVNRKRPEKRLEEQRKWRAANPEKARNYCKKYRAAHPEKIAEQGFRKLAKYKWMKEKLLELGIQV